MYMSSKCDMYSMDHIGASTYQNRFDPKIMTLFDTHPCFFNFLINSIRTQAMQIDAFNPMVFATNGFAFLARGNIKRWGPISPFSICVQFKGFY